MGKEFQVDLPKLGESIVSATVVQWFKKEGESVKLDEPLLEVSTDKVNSEIPSPSAGILKKIIAHPDQELDVGQPLCTLETDDGKETFEEKASETVKVEESDSTSMKRYYSPVVMKIAQQEGIPLTTLEKIPATGVGGRVSKRDLLAYLASSCAKSEPLADEIKLSGMRKHIADNMVKSFYEAPHASLVSEVDVTDVMKHIKTEKEAFIKKHGVKLSITSFVAQAIANAVQEFPFINSSLQNDTIYLKRFVNLGIAVSVDQGIMVPVIKHCHEKSLPDIARGVASLSEKARSNTLSPDDIQDGTITLTNFGMSGTLIGIPIIRYPEVAIIGIGAIQNKVVALDDQTMAIRKCMHISLTFDHRVLDGMYGCGFLSAIKKHLEEDYES